MSAQREDTLEKLAPPFSLILLGIIMNSSQSTFEQLAAENSTEKKYAVVSPLELNQARLQALNKRVQHDTVEICDIYLQRPQHLAKLSFGVWFNSAHNLKDHDLQHCAAGSEAKRIIVRKGYNFLPLEILTRFNRGVVAGELE